VLSAAPGIVAAEEGEVKREAGFVGMVPKTVFAKCYTFFVSKKGAPRGHWQKSAWHRSDARAARRNGLQGRECPLGEVTATEPP
jgi:hypothetical protein